MCCSVSPDVQVLFSNTILYAAEVINLQRETVHVLGYQNTAQNNINSIIKDLNSVDFPPYKPDGFWNKLRDIFSPQLSKNKPTGTPAGESTGNAMLLPFPAVPRTMSQNNILETKICPNILKDIADAVKPPVVHEFSALPLESFQFQAVQIFEAAGIYTVVLAQDARAIPDALSQVPKEKRPQLNHELFEAYAKWYPEWTFALCCFNNEEAKEALPMLWWYAPMSPDKLFLPALDSHTGNVPRLQADVMVDHAVAVGSYLAEAISPQSKPPAKDCPQCQTANLKNDNFCRVCGSRLSPMADKHDYQEVSYRDRNIIPHHLKSYLLPKVMGQIYNQVMPNGDFICRIDEVRQGIFNPLRCSPPFAK